MQTSTTTKQSHPPPAGPKKRDNNRNIALASNTFSRIVKLQTLYIVLRLVALVRHKKPKHFHRVQVLPLRGCSPSKPIFFCDLEEAVSVAIQIETYKSDFLLTEGVVGCSCFLSSCWQQQGTRPHISCAFQWQLALMRALYRQW
eukprot:5651418-Amphidinium_carterae.1